MNKPIIFDNGTLKYYDVSLLEGGYVDAKFDINQSMINNLDKYNTFFQYIVYYINGGNKYTIEEHDTSTKYGFCKMRQALCELNKKLDADKNKCADYDILKETIEIFSKNFKKLGYDSESYKNIINSNGYQEFNNKYMSKVITNNGRIVQ